MLVKEKENLVRITHAKRENKKKSRNGAKLFVQYFFFHSLFFRLNGFIWLGFRATISPIDFAIVTTCLREFVIGGGILHVLFDPVK